MIGRNKRKVVAFEKILTKLTFYSVKIIHHVLVYGPKGST